MREKQRAKDEVNRLNGVVSGGSGAAAGPPSQEPNGGSSSGGGAPWRRRPNFHPPTNGTRQATPAERRQQLAQLAEMGVAVPEEFRRDLAMAGDWQVVSEKPLYEASVKEEEGGYEESKPPQGMSIGVRKRKFEGQEEAEGEEDEAGEMVARKGWGSMLHTYPDPRGEEDLDSLLGKTKPSHVVRDHQSRDDTQGSGSFAPPPPPPPPPPVDNAQHQRGINTVPEHQSPYPNPPIKQEDTTDETKPLLPINSSSWSNNIKKEFKEDPDGPEQSGIVFKKRKAKPIRNK